jgi:hypothetical protein
MTEEEWLACAYPLRMMQFLEARASMRRIRLFTSAVLRRDETLMTFGAWRRAMEVSERFADGEATTAEWHSACTALQEACKGNDPEPTPDIVGSYRESDREMLVGLVRDIFGNPFRHVSIHPAWLMWHEGAIPRLAQAIYAERAFDRLPILADALENAGCDDANILAHCRQPGEHVRGCWVVDLLLGKE